jgi:hypothetical protein
MAVASPVVNELHMVKESLGAIAQIEQVFVSSITGSLSVLIVVPEHDPAVERDIFAAEAEIIDYFSWLNVDFDVVFRCGRQLTDVVSPQGVQLFAR